MRTTVEPICTQFFNVNGQEIFEIRVGGIRIDPNEEYFKVYQILTEAGFNYTKIRSHEELHMFGLNGVVYLISTDVRANLIIRR